MGIELDVRKMNDSLNKFVTKPNLAPPSNAYLLSVKADALRLANLHREALVKYLNVLLIERENPDALYGLGVCYRYLENYDKSIEILEHAVKVREGHFETYYELGISYLLKGVPCMAIKNLVQAIQINTEHSDAQIQLALAHELCEEADMPLDKTA